ncbi:MAG: hypothetical protein KJT01_17045, partial [Gemmatimonadetes bacterium]|nr:hypothetical protein [Gemmatimonadota bacterium]
MAACILAATAARDVQAQATPPYEVVLYGPEEAVFTNANPWGLINFPDGPLSFRRVGNEVRVWFTNSVAAVQMRGPSFDSLVPFPLQGGRVVPGLVPSRAGFDSNYTGANAVITAADGTTLLNFYHAESQPCGGPFPFLAGIGVARSTDGGVTWQRRGQVIGSSAPRPTGCAYDMWGVNMPTVFRSRDGRYLYMLFLEQLRAAPYGRADVLYLARAAVESDGEPGAWFKYANGGFTQPGLTGVGTPVIGQPPPNGPTTIYAFGAAVSYNLALGRYLAVFQSRIGFHTTTSADGIVWDTPALLWATADPYTGNTTGVPWVTYPSILSHDQSSQETTGQAGYLYFARGSP